MLFNLAGVTAGATNLCIDDANSRVGVGTTSPSTALEAIGTSRFSRADATPVGTASTTNDDAVFGSTDTTNAGVTFFSSGTSGINFGDAADNDVGQIRYDNSTNKLFFRTNASDRVTIDAAGNVGLGTATPGFDLHVQAPGGITAKFENTGNDGVEFILDANRGAENLVLGVYRAQWNGKTVGDLLFLAGPDTTNKDDGKLDLRTAKPGGLMTTAIRIDENQDVGIGTTDPLDPLHVVGLVRVQEVGDNANFGNIMAEFDDLVFDSFGTAANSAGMRFRVDDATVVAMAIEPNGEIGIGTVSPTSTLDVVGSIEATSLAGGGVIIDVCANNTGVLFTATTCTPSIRAAKRNITDLDLGLDAVLALRPVTFDWRPGYRVGPRQLGFIAEEVEAISPLLAAYDHETGELRSVLYAEMSALSVKAIQELSRRLDRLQVRAPAATLWSSATDARINTDVTGLDSALDVIGRLRAVKFRYNEDYRSAVPGLGGEYFYSFIAQEYREVFPEGVKEGPDGYLAVDTSAVQPYLVAAVQELVDIINTQKDQIAVLNEQVGALRTQSRSVDTLTQLIVAQQDQITQLQRSVSQILSGQTPPRAIEAGQQQQ